MNPYYRCFEAADGFVAVACLNLAQRRAFLGLFGSDDPTVDAPDLVPDDPAVLAAKQELTSAIAHAVRAEVRRGLARGARGGRGAVRTRPAAGDDPRRSAGDRRAARRARRAARPRGARPPRAVRPRRWRTRVRPPRLPRSAPTPTPSSESSREVRGLGRADALRGRDARGGRRLASATRARARELAGRPRRRARRAGRRSRLGRALGRRRSCSAPSWPEGSSSGASPRRSASSTRPRSERRSASTGGRGMVVDAASLAVPSRAGGLGLGPPSPDGRLEITLDGSGTVQVDVTRDRRARVRSRPWPAGAHGTPRRSRMSRDSRNVRSSSRSSTPARGCSSARPSRRFPPSRRASPMQLWPPTPSSCSRGRRRPTRAGSRSAELRWACEACCDVTAAAHQVHGAVGFALETGLHVYHRRARSVQAWTAAACAAAR